MQWIKRNLFFAIGGFVALALMVLAVLYVMQSMKNSSDVQEEINAQIAELTRLYEKDPFPSEENIALAKQEQQKVKDLLNDQKSFFVPIQSFTAADNHTFQEILGNTIVGLQRQASSLGVAIPPQYAFTFSGQRNALQLSPSSIAPWLTQLAEIQAISGVLYQAKINELYGIRRVPLTEDDRRQANTTDYLTSPTIVTNQTAVFTPYEISFRGFSAEIANVLTGFLQSSNSFLIKSISVDPAGATGQAQGLNPSAAFNPRALIPPAVVNPDGTPVVRPVRPGAKGAAPAAVTVLSERPLRVTMLVETVRLRERK